MLDSVILTTPLILSLSLCAIILQFITIFIKSNVTKYVLNICGFLCVAASITYSLLLGASLNEIVVYVLFFTLLAAIPFYFYNKSKKKNTANRRENESTESQDNDQNSDDKEESSEKDEPSEKDEVTDEL